MTREELLALPPIVDVATAARALGVSRSVAYELVRSDRWPTPVVRLGRFIRVPSGPLLDLLSLRAGPAGN